MSPHELIVSSIRRLYVNILVAAVGLVSIVLLIACQWTSTSSLISTPIPASDLSITKAHPTITPIPTPQTRLQLTFFSSPISNRPAHSIYGITMECLAEPRPCFDTPLLLLELDQELLSFSWSPDGQRIAFSALGVENKGDIFVADWNGQNVQNITESPSYDDFPAWSPDGLNIAYETCTYEGCHLILAHPNGSDRRQLLTAAQIYSPRLVAWAPTGQQITFVGRGPTGAYEQVFIANLDGSGLVQLTARPTPHFSPAFSRDGRWLAFERIRDPETLTDSDIFLLRTDGTDERNLTKGVLQSPTYVAWSPQGNWLAVDGSEYKKGDVFLVSQDGEQLINVTQDRRDHSHHPVWRLISVP
jgi:Tol biopolymer transport system component